MPVTPTQAANHILKVVEPAVVRELDASKTAILAELGVVERAILNRCWGLVENEVRRVVGAAIAAACRDLGTLSINEAVTRII